MPTYDIPKLARNKYNVVKDNSANNVVTTSQLMTSFGAGNSSGGGIGITHNTFQTQAQVESAIEKASYNDKISTYTYLQTYYVASADLKTINGYSLIGEGDIEVTGGGTVDLSAYATKSYVADYVATYAPEPDLSAYVSKVELDNASYMNAYVLPQNDYDNLSTADKNKNTIYLISDQTAYEYNELVTVQEMNDTINSYGFLTSANFEYDSYTGTLTMRI